MPKPYWIAPTRAETAPARCGKRDKAPAIELAMMKPEADTKTKRGTARPQKAESVRAGCHGQHEPRDRGYACPDIQQPIAS